MGLRYKGNKMLSTSYGSTDEGEKGGKYPGG